MNHYDVIVIGSGPGGEGAAMQAVKGGRSVCVVELHKEVGGGCTHWGTIPTKALRHAVMRMAEFRSNPLYGIREQWEPGFPAFLRTAESVIRRQVGMRQTFYDRNAVKVLHARARFVDDHRLEVTGEDGSSDIIAADHVVIATGSRPYRPEGVDFGHPRVRDSDTILRLDRSPQSITIYGAGVVGCEYASIFRGLQIKVNLVNTRDKLLSFLDDEIVDALAYHLRDHGVVIRHNETMERVEARDDCVVLHTRSGKAIKSDLLLWANGRSGNTQGMNLAEIGVAVDERGTVKVDEDYRTSVPHIYAAGDVIGWPSLASAAYEQGRSAAQHLLTGRCETRLSRDIPTGIYTSPEISSLGKSERELTAAKVPYEVGHSLFRSLAAAQISGQTTGMLKILFHRETLEILGIHCFGQGAAEIIHIGQAIMTQPPPNNTIRWFAATTFNYPTMAEAYRVAALNGLNRLF
ncbi:MAG: Si-specific NAD(P)(+) transhydrogenase [Planctomycetes bacterium]|nr:Si-specific NAD(P)(+) transhydrogenase [Planctomycetota bacterium]